MSINSQLQKVFRVNDPVSRGTVASISESSIFVSSPVGLKEFQVPAPGAFNVGDEVKFQGNTYLGRIPSSLSSKRIVV